jgi:hypothetical protein
MVLARWKPEHFIAQSVGCEVQKGDLVGSLKSTLPLAESGKGLVAPPLRGHLSAYELWSESLAAPFRSFLLSPASSPKSGLI